MTNFETISGFSKLSRDEKINLLRISNTDKLYLNESTVHSAYLQEIVDELSENTIANFVLPFGLAPNAIINGENYIIPLVTEESSVVAAISKSLKFWAQFGGFSAKVQGTKKKGQVHFFYKGSKKAFINKESELKSFILENTAHLTHRMVRRGGGITQLAIVDKTNTIQDYYCIDADFETMNAMGANFINTCLEEMAQNLKRFFEIDKDLDIADLEVNMAILSNYTPDSKVLAKVSCPVTDLDDYGKKLGVNNFTDKFIKAFRIANEDVSRAVTHNKGIFNAVDAVLLATANDWRAVEAGAHAFASRDGNYRSLSKAYTNNLIFNLELEIPMAIGTVGGVTNLHPISNLALNILKKPSAEQLMMVVAVSGLAANFSAVSALISTGIQQGHMKMHMSNLNRQEAIMEKEKSEDSAILIQSKRNLESHPNK